MATHTYEIVKQYTFHFDGFGPTVKGRVSQAIGKSDEHSFMWEISHHYKPSEKSAGVYYPSATRGKSLKEVEGLLMAYAENFSGIGVEENENF